MFNIDVSAVELVESALQGHHQSIQFTPHDAVFSVAELFERFHAGFTQVLLKLFKYGKDIKIQLKIFCKFVKWDGVNQREEM